jgi:hypothetical protein
MRWTVLSRCVVAGGGRGLKALPITGIRDPHNRHNNNNNNKVTTSAVDLRCVYERILYVYAPSLTR